jgi:type VI secretion system protein ImpJ
MSSFSKVAWREGLFLQQQHLQQADRYLEHQLEARLRDLTPWPWGITEMTLDRDLAQQGKIGLRSITGIMPDGLPFDAPATSALPMPVPCPEDAAGQGVWLTLPEASPNGRDIGLDGTSADAADGSAAVTRWRLTTEYVADNAAEGRQEQLIEVAEPRLELVVRKTPRPGYQSICIARIHEMRNGIIAFDDSTPPPALVTRAHPALSGYLDRVSGWVEARLETLARYAADPSSGGGLQATDYLQLMLLNREIAVLRHMARLPALHPEDLYRRLLGIAGELATFNDGARLAAVYPPYDHNDLKASFAPVVQDIQRALSRDVGRAVRLNLRKVRQNSYLTEVTDRNLFRDATFVIEVESTRPMSQVMAQFPQLCKVGPNTRMSEIVKNNLPGITLLHLPNPPRQIRVVTSNVYFLLDRNTPYWQEFSVAPAIGMHFAGDWPDLKMEFWAIPEKG